VIQDRILPSLSPGINVLTVHPRYWSFYTFVVDEFWRRDLPRTPQRFNAFMKRRESIFAIACLWCEWHYYDIPQLIGYEKLSKVVSAEPDSYDPDIYYLKNPRGGYAVYASALAEQGLIALASGPAGQSFPTRVRHRCRRTGSERTTADRTGPCSVRDRYDGGGSRLRSA
jgi:hypothetical protein